MFFTESQKTQKAEAVDFWVPVYGRRSMGAGIAPFLTIFAGLPPCTRRPLLKKGSIRKLYLRADNMFLTERYRIRNAGAVDFWVTVYGYRSPSPLWVFCAFVHGGRHRRKPLGFRRCLPPARPEKAKPFQAGRSPCTKHRQTVRLCLYAPKKFLRVPRGGFSKTLLGREWDSVPQREGEPVSEVRLFRRDKGLSRNAHRSSGFAFTPKKSF